MGVHIYYTLRSVVDMGAFYGVHAIIFRQIAGNSVFIQDGGCYLSRLVTRTKEYNM